MIGELAIETLQVTWATSSNYPRDDISRSGPFDCLWLTPWCPIGLVKPFGNPGHTEPFLNLGASGDNFVLLSEVVIYLSLAMWSFSHLSCCSHWQRARSLVPSCQS